MRVLVRSYGGVDFFAASLRDAVEGTRKPFLVSLYALEYKLLHNSLRSGHFECIVSESDNYTNAIYMLEFFESERKYC